MIMKVRLEVLKDKKPQEYKLSEKYFKFLGERTKLHLFSFKTPILKYKIDLNIIYIFNYIKSKWRTTTIKIIKILCWK